MDVTIYHNPRCSKSRETLALLEDRGVHPRVVKYLDTPLDVAGLRALLALLKLTPRELLRTTEDAYRNLDLANPSRSDDELLAAIAKHPELMQRPVVVAGDHARIGRPPEVVLEIIE